MQRQKKTPTLSLCNIQNKILRIKRDNVLGLKIRKNNGIPVATLDMLTSLFPEPLCSLHLWAFARTWPSACGAALPIALPGKPSAPLKMYPGRKSSLRCFPERPTELGATIAFWSALYYTSQLLVTPSVRCWVLLHLGCEHPHRG